MHHWKLLNYPISLASIVSPFWLPWLEQVSKIAGLVLPILGVGWLCLQAILAILAHRRGHKWDE